MQSKRLERWRRRTILILAPIGIVNCVIFWVMNWFGGMVFASFINFVIGVTLGAALILEWMYRHTRAAAGLAVLSVMFLLFLGGTTGAVNVYVWLPAIPILSFLMLQFQRGVIISVVSFVGLVGLLSYRSPEFIKPGIELSVLSSYLFAALFAGFYEYLRIVHQKEIQELSETDSLTGLPNRRRLMDVLEREIARSNRYGHPLSLVIFDVDKFKTINDSHGHLVGDEVLEKLGNLVGEQIRACDHAARFGGDEFVVVAPETEVDGEEGGAGALVERLRAEIEAFDFGVGGVTVSLGVASLEAEDTPETLMQRADTALYRAKAQGGNQVATIPAGDGKH